MPNYHLNTEPDRKGNYCLHIENCPCLQNSKTFTLVGNFDKLEEVVGVIKSSDYSVTLCKDCIDINYAKSNITTKEPLLNRLQNFIKKIWS